MKSAAAPVGQPRLWTLAYGHHEDRTPTHGYEPTREARWRSHQRRARRCRLQRRRLGTMRTGANYSLWMVGRQARHGGPTCVQKYILSEAGGRGRRCCGVGREEDSDLPGFLFPKFFRKKFGQKIGAGPQWRIFGNGTCAGPGPAPPRPPFVQMKNTAPFADFRPSPL